MKTLTTHCLCQELLHNLKSNAMIQIQTTRSVCSTIICISVSIPLNLFFQNHLNVCDFKYLLDESMLISIWFISWLPQFKQNSKPCDHYVSNDQKRIRHSNAQQERKSQIWCSDLSISISCCLNLKFPAFTVVWWFMLKLYIPGACPRNAHGTTALAIPPSTSPAVEFMTLFSTEAECGLPLEVSMWLSRCRLCWCWWWCTRSCLSPLSYWTAGRRCGTWLFECLPPVV